jgi:uncharacterized RDD family membrane protein YckC
MTADDYIDDVLRRMPAATPRRNQIGTELRGHIAERMAQGRSLDQVLRDLGEPGALADSYLAGLPMGLPRHGARILAKIVDVAVLALAIIAIAVPAFALATRAAEGLVFFVLISSVVLGSILTAFYTIVAEWRYGCTVGKYLNGLRVVRESGARITFGQSVVRQLPMFLQVGWVDAMFALFTDRRQRAFELLSKTRVVAAEPSDSQQPVFASEH